MLLAVGASRCLEQARAAACSRRCLPPSRSPHACGRHAAPDLTAKRFSIAAASPNPVRLPMRQREESWEPAKPPAPGGRCRPAGEQLPPPLPGAFASLRGMPRPCKARQKLDEQRT